MSLIPTTPRAAFPPFDVGLGSGTRWPFARQLPVFNWFYPFDFEEERAAIPSAALGSIDLPGIRRTAAYLHIPFCDTVCSFCPFTRGRYSREDEVADYVKALAREMEIKAAIMGRVQVDSVFIGGGTPSILTPEQIARTGDCIHTYLDTGQVYEFAVEVEVKSVTRQKLSALKRIGVTRVSFGAQTFLPDHRRAFNLDASIDQVRRAADLVNDEFPSTNVDVIYGMPGETIDDVVADADAAVALGSTTIDFYPLNNLAAQVRMHRRFEALGLRRLTAPDRLEHRRVIANHMRGLGYAPINGYGYARKAEDTDGVIQHAPRFVYHDILYGHHDDAVLGYGASAITQVPGYNLYNASARSEYMRSLNAKAALPIAAFPIGPTPEKGLVTFPYRGQVAKAAIPWDSVGQETLVSLAKLTDAGLVEETEDAFAVTESGWLFYVNLMYVLMPRRGKTWITQRIATREAAGHESEATDL